jgi:hypothetical protein
MTTPNLPSAEIVESVAELWGLPLQPAGCARCGQAHLVSADHVGGLCPNCARGRLEPQPARLRPEAPELLAPFDKTRAELPALLNRFINDVWLRPDDLDAAKMASRALPVFWPMWLVDGDVAGNWQAEMGFDYQVKSSQESYSDGGWRSNEVVETRVRWEPRVGQLRRRYDNIAVPAASDSDALQKRIGAFRLDRAQAYDSAQIQEAALRAPDLLPESAWPLAQNGLRHAAAEECTKAAQAQHVRNFALHAAYESLHWTQLLLPLYVTFYKDDEGQAHPIYINGQTGVVGGLRLASAKKGRLWAGVLLAIALGLFILGLLLGLISLVIPFLIPVAGLCILGAFPLGLAALVPALWPGQWNRREGGDK